MSIAHAAIQQLYQHVSKQVIGQEKLISRLLVALLANGHLLVEGAPGLAKTRAVRALAACVEGQFQRIQFTPDLLPSDLTGTEIFRPQEGSFSFHRGPLFHNLILADEVNRAPAKVQSALLEAMGERRITVGGTTYELPPLFLVMATQNPIEQEGTYPLPEAQLDRFLLMVEVDYPPLEAEQQVLALARQEALAGEAFDLSTGFRVEQNTLFAARKETLAVHMSPAVETYLLHLVRATRAPHPYGAHLAAWVQYGASPRGSIALDRTARVWAWLAGRDFVTPEDVQEMAMDVLRHRVIMSYEAEAQGIDSDRLITELLTRVPVP